MSRNARRIAVSLGTAAGAALIAASISMDTAPVAGADAVSDLIGASAAEALPAVGATDADPLTDLVAAFDPNAFASAGAPTDVFGVFAYYTDTYLLGPSGLGDALDPSVDSYLASLPTAAAEALPAVGATDADPLTDLVAAFDPNAFTSAGAPTDVFGVFAYYTDTYLLGPSGLGDALDPGVDSFLSSLPSPAESVDVSPVSDLIAALDPSAFSAGAADLTAVIDGLLNSGLSLF
jgi:hypothetical protein